MEFLKEILGEDFDRVKDKIEKYNQGAESPVKIVNLSDGGYVRREKYNALLGSAGKEKEEGEKLLRQEIEQLKAKMQENETQHKIDMLIKNSGAKNVKAVKALIETDGADEENLTVQLEKIKAGNSYLFDKTTAGATGMRQGSPGKETTARDELKMKLFGKI